MNPAAVLDVLEEQKYIRLTTFRKDGTPVPTPVWLAREGDHVLVTTSATTGKAKRLRHTQRVLVAPSDARGGVETGVVDVEATAELITEPGEAMRIRQVIGSRYGWTFKAFALMYRLRGETDDSTVGIRISFG